MLRQLLSRNTTQFGTFFNLRQVERSVRHLSTLKLIKSDEYLTSRKITLPASIKLQTGNYCTAEGEKVKKKKQKKNPPAVEHVGRLDMRVGRIVEVQKATDSDTLYLTKVDVGGDIRSIVTGLAKFIPEDQLLNQNVVILCNIKPSKLRGHLSEGMIMCAKSDEVIEPLVPPSNAEPGDLIYCENFERVPVEAPRDKKKLFDPIASDLTINSDLIACYQTSYLYIPEKGNIVAKSLRNADIM